MKNFKLVPEVEWPNHNQKNLKQVYLNNEFLVQEFHEDNNVIRLSVCSVKRKGSKWVDGITWDQLNEIKSKVGFSNMFALECYPEQKNIVNVANMRHLWILPERLPFAWQKTA